MTVPMGPSGIIATLKAVYSTAKAFEQAPNQAAVLALMETVRDAQGAAFDMEEELRAARSKIAELEAAARTHASLTFERGVYWSGSSREHGPDGPYCTRCYDADRKLMRLSVGGMASYATCPQQSCNAAFSVWPERAESGPTGHSFDSYTGPGW